MPQYLFQKPSTGRLGWFFFGMNEVKEVIDADKEKWIRIYVNPQVSFDTKCDPYSEKDFVKATDKKGTMGDLYDRSMELHHKRKDKDGKDPFREDFYRKYSKKHKGQKHPLEKRAEVSEQLKRVGMSVEYPDL